jgi:integrase/recombinase XerC
MAPFFLSEFENYLKVEKRFSNYTLLAYKKDIEQFSVFASISELHDFYKISSSTVRAWIVSLVDNSMENKSVNRKLSALRAFFKWLKKEYNITSNPLAKIKGPKNIKRLPQFAKVSELNNNKLSEVIPNGFDGLRDRLIFEVFYQTGIRLSELVNLKESAINDHSLKVLGKRNKERIIPIATQLNYLINEYKTAKKELGLQNEYLFVLPNGNKLYAKFVYRRINKYLSETTSLDKCSPHVLRHTFATHMLNNGAGLETLKEILGHANLGATQIYTHNSFASLVNVYSQAHPRGHKNT